jgi:hypothetical protein
VRCAAGLKNLSTESYWSPRQLVQLLLPRGADFTYSTPNDRCSTGGIFGNVPCQAGSLELRLKSQISYKELNSFEKMPVVLLSKDVEMTFNPTIIIKPKIMFREEHSQSLS